MSLSAESALIMIIAMNGLTWIVLVALALRGFVKRRAERARRARWLQGITETLRKTLEAYGQDPSPSAPSQPPQVSGGSNAQR